ncbi:MAG: peptide chain release factor aRF-1 [Nanoarchaeota archaeon]|nr:peptide chain release factor aRF-1 [Nanoarchaeota archaeon]
MDDTKKRQFTALVKELAVLRGRHTELVSVYIPAGYQMTKVVDQLRSEQSTATNIKSKATRKNVVSALEKILQHLKTHSQTPPNGLVVLCGNVSDKEGVDDIQLWSFEPPEPLQVRLYRCDQTFIVDPLLDMIREREIYGLIIVDKSDATIGMLRGKRIKKIKTLTSTVPGKTQAGGWSQHRYERIREQALHEFIKKVGAIASEKFMEEKDLKGIIVGGPGPVKEQFVDGEFLDYRLQKQILGIVSTSYTGEIGLRELVERGEDLIKQASAVHERQILERYFEELAKDTGLAIYGFREVKKILEAGAVDLLLLSEKFDWVTVDLTCPTCKKKETKTLTRQKLPEQKCEQCGITMTVTSEHEVTEELIKIAEQMGTAVEVISTDTPRGEQLAALGGIGAVLRYKV